MDRDRNIVDMDGEPTTEPITMDCDTNFPMYLCQKGTKVIANTVTSKANVLEQIVGYTQYTRSMPIPRHAVMNEYEEG